MEGCLEVESLEREWSLGGVLLNDTKALLEDSPESFLIPSFMGKHRMCILSSVQFSRLVVSDSLQPHELQHARPPCPSPTPADMKYIGALIMYFPAYRN